MAGCDGIDPFLFHVRLRAVKALGGGNDGFWAEWGTVMKQGYVLLQLAIAYPHPIVAAAQNAVTGVTMVFKVNGCFQSKPACW